MDRDSPADEVLIDVLSQDNDETRASLERIVDACPGPAYSGVVLAKIANKLDPENIHRITEIEDAIIDVLDDTGPEDEQFLRVIGGV